MGSLHDSGTLNHGMRWHVGGTQHRVYPTNRILAERHRLEIEAEPSIWDAIKARLPEEQQRWAKANQKASRNILSAVRLKGDAHRDTIRKIHRLQDATNSAHHLWELLRSKAYHDSEADQEELAFDTFDTNPASESPCRSPSTPRGVWAANRAVRRF